MKKGVFGVFSILSGILIFSCTDSKTTEDETFSDSYLEEIDSNDVDSENEFDVQPDIELDEKTDGVDDSVNDSGFDSENDTDTQTDEEPDMLPDIDYPDDDVEIPSGTTEYQVDLPEGGIYRKGFFFTATVQGDQVDFYVPLSSKDKMSTVIYLQGAKVDKGFYSVFAKIISTYGFVVAIPNHSSFSGENMTENKVFSQSWEYIKSQNLCHIFITELKLQKSRSWVTLWEVWRHSVCFRINVKCRHAPAVILILLNLPLLFFTVRTRKTLISEELRKLAPAIFL
jgi:hypothetical protein